MFVICMPASIPSHFIIFMLLSLPLTFFYLYIYTEDYVKYKSSFFNNNKMS